MSENPRMTELAENWEFTWFSVFKNGVLFWGSTGEARSDQLLPILHTGVPREKSPIEKTTNLV